MSDDQHIHIHNNAMDSNAHVWRVVSTFLAIGALVSLAWGLAQFGMLELAATGTAAVFSMLVQLLMRNGFIVLPESASDDARIEEGKNALKAIIGMVQAILDRSSILRLTLIAISYGVLFILVRTLIQYALGVFGNIWIALAAGGLVASVICFPTLFAGLFRAMKAKRGPLREGGDS
jgi:hypothetical protein